MGANRNHPIIAHKGMGGDPPWEVGVVPLTATRCLVTYVAKL